MEQTAPAVAVGSRAHLVDEAVVNVSQDYVLLHNLSISLHVYYNGYPSSSQRSFFRNFLMYGFHFLVYVLCVRGIKDTQCGFKMFTRSAAARLFKIVHIDRWYDVAFAISVRLARKSAPDFSFARLIVVLCIDFVNLRLSFVFSR